LHSSLHEKIPMPTADEQQALQLENAKADKQFYETLRAMHAQMVEERKALATMVEGDIAKSQSAMEDVADRAAAAKDRIARIERGEAVAGGLGKPEIKDLAKTLGLSRSEFRHMQRLAELGKGEFEAFLEDVHRRKEQAEKRAALAAFKRRRPQPGTHGN
jgi:hypothetical protein